MPEYRVYFYNEQHKSYLVEISILWKVRQQLYWGLGLSQVLIVSALLIKIRHIGDYLDQANDSQEIRSKMMQADKRAKRLYIVVSVLFGITAIAVIVLSFPVMSIISQQGYNIVNLTQMIVTLLGISLILWWLDTMIADLN